MSFKFLDWQEWNILIMLLREKGRERESGGRGGEKTNTQSHKLQEKRNGKKKCFSGACVADGQCFPLVVLASR